MAGKDGADASGVATRTFEEMTERLSLRMWNAQQGHQQLETAWRHAKVLLTAGHRLILEVRPETRSLESNAVMWARLTDVSNQVEWYGKRLTPEDWKHVFSASLRKLEVVPNLDGTGFVALGLSTSKMTRKEMEDMKELILAFGSNRTPPVRWSIASLCGEPE